jgi:Derlin-2/3
LYYRTITALCILESLIVKVGLVNVYKVLFHHSFLVQFPPQIWRLSTSFLLAGDGLGIIFDPYFCA